MSPALPAPVRLDHTHHGAELGAQAWPRGPTPDAVTLRHWPDAADQGHTPDGAAMVWQRLTGDWIVTARLRHLQGAPGACAGWTVRTSLEAGAACLCLQVDAGGMAQLVWHQPAHTTVVDCVPVTVRSEAPDDGPKPSAPAAAMTGQRDHAVLQLERRGAQWLAWVARDGEPWQALDASAMLGALPDTLIIGLFVSAAAGSPTQASAPVHGPALATFDNIRWVRPLDRAVPLFDQPAVHSRLEWLDVDSGTRTVVHEADVLFEAPNWSRCGRFLLYNQQGRLWRHDLADGQQHLLDTGHAQRNNNDHVISFDGRWLAICNRSDDDVPRIHVLPIEGGAPRLVTRDGPSYLHGWSPDGHHLVFTGRREGHQALNLYRIGVDGQGEQRLTVCDALDDGPEYSPDGRYLYFNSARSGRMRLWRIDADGANPVGLTDDGYDDWFPHASPDGRHLAFLSYLPGETAPQDHPGGRQVLLRLLNLISGDLRVLAYVYGGQGTLNVHSWSPDGQRLAFVSHSAPG